MNARTMGSGINGECELTCISEILGIPVQKFPPPRDVGSEIVIRRRRIVGAGGHQRHKCEHCHVVQWQLQPEKPLVQL